jgi:hypothetical protein
MNVEIGAEAAQFPEKEYINGIAVAVCDTEIQKLSCTFALGLDFESLRQGSNQKIVFTPTTFFSIFYIDFIHDESLEL